jgi:hypothetical protein
MIRMTLWSYTTLTDATHCERTEKRRHETP